MTERNDSSMGPPGWASFFGPEGWARFLIAIADDLEGRGEAHTIDADAGCVRLAAGPVLGLTNIAQVCSKEPRDKWPAIIGHHFTIATKPHEEVMAAMGEDFELARGALKLRFWSRESLPNAKTPLVVWDIADDLVAVLTYDLPEVLATVSRDAAERWPVSKEELWRIGLANIRADGLLSASAVDLGNGSEIQILEGGGTFFGASHALLLEAYGSVPPHGLLVGVPHRHAAIFHRIVDLRVIDAINSMAYAVPRMFQEGPGSITPSLYWLRTGIEQEWMRLPMSVSDETVELTPPAAFTEMLNRLRPPDRS